MARKRVTAQDLYNFTKCLHRVFLDSNGDPWEKSEVSSFVKLLWEVFFVGKQKFALRQQGLRTIDDIARMDVQTYLIPPPQDSENGENLSDADEGTGASPLRRKAGDPSGLYVS
jgi:hypothetical protein